MKFLTADIGSTYTKLAAIDSATSEILATSASFTTISTDVTKGFYNALEILENKIGKFDYDKLLCCSSAAGGLKMVALGLVPSLTAKAAKMAASSAGAKVVKTYSFEISNAEAKEIEEISPDLVLLCGGTDGGNKEIIIANAQKLSTIKGTFSVIVAGNKSAEDQIAQILRESDKHWTITQNVMPEFNKLNIEPAKECIRELFIERIIEAKGLTTISKMCTGDVIPTPLAVMQGCSLLSIGTEEQEGVGELIAVDLGGATTDVYSMTEGTPSRDDIVFRGLPEPFAKRSVEGDLGMRYSLKFLAHECTHKWIAAEAGESEELVKEWIKTCCAQPDTIAPHGSPQQRIEEALAKGAVKTALERHCGYIEPVYTPMGQMYTINGKDLTNVPLAIGIGGAIINSPHPNKIMEGVKAGKGDLNYAKPKDPVVKTDSSYILASMGLLSAFDPETALAIMKKEIFNKI